MKQTRLLMGMPITVELADVKAVTADFDAVYGYLTEVDNRFSTYKETSEISRINAGQLPDSEWSPDMRMVFQLCEQTKRETNGYFDIMHDGRRDPSGLVKGWAVYHAAELLRKRGRRNFTIEAGGDIQASGVNASGAFWRVGIRNPFKRTETVKAVMVHNEGVATSGTYIRGQHVYNPLAPDSKLAEVVSLTVIGPNVYEADRFATAAFAMGLQGISFIERLEGFEGYMINKQGTATMTTGFERYVMTS